ADTKARWLRRHYACLDVLHRRYHWARAPLFFEASRPENSFAADCSDFSENDADFLFLVPLLI
ncbi:MAG TPA: hypothetical protein VKS79_22300, partial [Gemmataceae bacterium]|nr:hypothetical protein [Gemmataceae bacterium]